MNGSRLVCVATLICSLLGCGSRPEGAPTSAVSGARDVDPITGRPLEPLDPEGPRHDHVKVVERDPKDEHEVRIPLRAQQELEECHAKGGGKVRLRLRRENGRRTFEVVGARSLSPAEQRCVLDSLQRLRDDETPGALGARPDVPVTGFTSFLTVEW